MSTVEPWVSLSEALELAVASVVDDVDPLNPRELADGHSYVMRILQVIAETSLVAFDFERPSFLTMRESVRHLGAAGPDIDYDVGILAPGSRYRITGERGDASYVGIVVYGSGGAEGASAILDAIDVDTLVDASGGFTYLVDHPEAARVIVRQYFHDRSAERSGSWDIERLHQDGAPQAPAADTGPESVRPQPAHPEPPYPDLAIVEHRFANSADTLRWNAQLNQLWTPERRAHPNDFIRLGAEDIVAAVPNPDVTYAFTWWRIGEGEALVIDVDPPETRYWAVQLCDRWFQSYPQRCTNLNDQQVTRRADGTVQVVLADHDPGTGNWLDTGGHHTGVVFFRWLHADPANLPECRVVPVDKLH
jgi:hypothetical protein